MLPSEKLQLLKIMSIVPVSKEIADDFFDDPDYYEICWYRHLGIVTPVEGELGCHIRARARYILAEAS
jgi:hypothetical protein